MKQVKPHFSLCKARNMNRQVAAKFESISSAERAQLIGSVHNFVSDSGFGNLVQNIDINDTKGRGPRSLHFVCSQLAAFNGVPGLATQVSAWLASI
jgi:hypothetical protein